MKTNLFKGGSFKSHAGLELSFKVECDALTNNDLETLADTVGNKIEYSNVYGIPRGGVRFAEALEKYKSSSGPTLIVDDVLTTGTSMEEARKEYGKDSVGLVIFARGTCPAWVKSIFNLSDWVEE